MSNPHGTPIWYELLTDDPDRAETFYGPAAGWSVSKARGGLERDYRIINADDSAIGGLMRRPEGAPMASSWLFYVGVDDVDASAEKLKRLGGSVHMGPMDIPDVGRFAFVTDPQGAPFYLMRGFSPEDSRAFVEKTVGHCVWNELVTSDQDAAFAFYGEMFGWTKDGAMPMGEMGDYSFIGHQGRMIGAIMNAQEPGTKPYWNFAFQVEDIDRTKSAVEDGGGTVRNGPMEIPGGDMLIQASDPAGAKVMFVASPKA